MRKSFLILVVALVQIFLLINGTPANSYIIKQTYPKIEKAINAGENKEKIPGLGLSFLIGLLSIQQIGTVSAEEISWNCCRETNEGAICQDISSTDTTSCAVEPLLSSCSQSADCKTGCCIDEQEGLCTTQATKYSCESEGGTWNDEASCLVEECQKGCCVLGSSVSFVTDTRCGRLSELYGFEKDFRDYTSELDCLALEETQAVGACISEGNSCTFGTESECVEQEGAFSENILCSSPDLNTSCEKQNSIGCEDEKDEIYWFDSCGNRENIYSSDKDFSWNNGSVLEKNESCDPNSANIDSTTCGNCNYYSGSKCSEVSSGGVTDGSFVCKNMNCIDEKGNERANGESWCVYDSFIGDGKDPAGSRHWKRMCIDGEIKIEACSDYRGQICVQSEVQSDETEEIYNSASCVDNEAVNCIEYNNGENETAMKENCEANNQCMIKSVDIDSGYRFDVCVGKYPRGFDLSAEADTETSEVLCELATQKCVVYYEKKLTGWECIYNCDCEEKKFAEQMNDFCISMGDCGSYINYIGDGSNNIEVTKSPSVSWEDYKNYSEPVEGQFAEPSNSTESAVYNLSGDMEGYSAEENALSSAITWLGTISGGTGLAIMAAGWAFPSILGSPAVMVADWAELSTPATTTLLGSFGNALGALGIGMGAASLLTLAFDLQGDAATVMAVAGVAAGVVLTAFVLSAGESTFVFCFSPGWVVCVVIIALLAIIAGLLKIFGIGETKERNVDFTCMKWEPPLGGDNCEQCNSDSLKPCTEYRCTSLGQACGLLNDDEENPACIRMYEDDSTPPDISAGDIAEGYVFQNEEDNSVAIRTSSGECIPEFTSVYYSLNTDEYAQCKFDVERKGNYDEMGSYFAEENSFTKSHTNAFMMPSLESLEVYNITGDIIQKFGSTDIYVICQDTYGNYNSNEYSVNFCIESGPDLTSAVISTMSPKNNSAIEYNSKESNATFYLNEPAECKWSQNENRSYDGMENSMSCNVELEDYEDYGWPCSTTFTDLENNANEFYILCRDQPWLGENDSRNINSDVFVYTLRGSQSELKIDSISPQGDMEEGFQPASVELKVQTSGGVEDGKASCYYGFNENSEIQFFDTFSSVHQQTLNLMEGGYLIYIKCQDEAGNKDSGSAVFSLYVDSTAPNVARMYKSGEKMKIITDEPANCYYDTTRCNFGIENGISMTTGFSTEHSADWNDELTYYVKCEDAWGNTNTECAVSVKASSFG